MSSTRELGLENFEHTCSITIRHHSGHDEKWEIGKKKNLTDNQACLHKLPFAAALLRRSVSRSCFWKSAENTQISDKKEKRSAALPKLVIKRVKLQNV